MTSKWTGNKGEWSELYAAVKIIGDQLIYVADRNGQKNPNEWMNVFEVIRKEAAERIVNYRLDPNSTDVVIDVDGKAPVTVSSCHFLKLSGWLFHEILTGKGASFSIDDRVENELKNLEITTLKAKSSDKSDIYLSLDDPRAGIRRNSIGFSIKSESGKPPTLFNTASASAAEYEVIGMNDDLAKDINSIRDAKGHASPKDRLNAMLSAGCTLSYIGYPFKANLGCAPFQENLELINPNLPQLIATVLLDYFSGKVSGRKISDICDYLTSVNPLNIFRPSVKYEFMIKNFLYASYCGMTATKLWDGRSDVNGGFIRVGKSGDILAFYALESDAFKNYLFENCFLEFPSTSEGHGNYGKVEKKNGKYIFKLNFQVRYSVR